AHRVNRRASAGAVPSASLAGLSASTGHRNQTHTGSRIYDRSCDDERVPDPRSERFQCSAAHAGGVRKRCLASPPPRRVYRRGMRSLVQSFLLLIARATDRELARYLEFLKAENRILRARLPKHFIVMPRERQRLLRYGRPLGPAIRELITIV